MGLSGHYDLEKHLVWLGSAAKRGCLRMPARPLSSFRMLAFNALRPPPPTLAQVVFNDKTPVFQKFNASNTRCVWWMRTVG